MVGVVGGGVGRGGVGFWPDTKSGGCCRFMARYEERGGGGGGGCARFLAQNEERGGGGGGWGVRSVSGPKRRAGGGGGGGGGSMIAYRGARDIEFMRADINRQRNRAAIL